MTPHIFIVVSSSSRRTTKKVSILVIYITVYALPRKPRPNGTRETGEKQILTLNVSLHALGTIIKPVQQPPPNTHGLGTKTQGLEDIRPARDAAVHVHLDPVKHVRAILLQLQQHHDGRRGGIEAPPAMVGEDNGLDAGLDGPLGVHPRLHALEDDGEAGDGAAQPGNVGPVYRGVDIAAHDAAEGAAFGVVDGAGAGDGGAQGLVGGYALVGLAFARDGGVDCEEEGFYALRLGGAQ